MTPAEMVNVSASGLVAATALTFVITYHRLAPWRSTPTGWYLMSFAGAIGGLALYTVLITAVGLNGLPAAVLRYIRGGLLFVVAALFIQGTRKVLQVQRGTPEDPPAGDPPPAA